MIGFYPVCPVSGQYVITTPSFDDVKIFLPDGKFFLLSTVSSKPGNRYIKVITKNGGIHSSVQLTHYDIMQGSRFTLQMTDKPVRLR